LSKRITVAIDGPAGAGKSTLARRIAAKMGYLYIDTGAMYRAVALWALRRKVAVSDMHRLEQLANEARIEFVSGDGKVLLNGEDVSDAIRTPEVSEAASEISRVLGVRRALVAKQREIGERASVVMEGRDIGSVVFPHADLKIFLDASPEVRASRRQRELEEKGEPMEFEKVLAEVHVRDRRDREREMSPLVRAADAVIVDNTAMDAEETARVIVLLAKEQAGAVAG
jgi:cytidylate kinase